ncbi:sulfite exporter TauE/SafE family protein [Cytobacillus sp. FJAT-54145]|uniref:Sulfite exporter TauE/SafE family protein n=1 Tax=Cytobacillus spartinae TaxID=3299023 RepID=A0ABW6K5M7_9BACI
MYQWLNDISHLLSQPFFTLVNSTEQVPLLAAFVLGLIGAVAPCQLTANIGAITLYGSKSLQYKKQWVEVTSFIFGKVVVFSILGLAVWLIGKELQYALPEYFSVIRKLMGPLLIVIGLVLLGFLKLRIFEKFTFPTIKGDGIIGSFLMGASFSLAFCPTMFSLFFLTLMPIVISTEYGAVLPSVFAIGTALPVLVVLSIIWLFGFDGLLMKKSRKIGWIVQKFAGTLMILIGLLDTITYWS